MKTKIFYLLPFFLLCLALSLLLTCKEKPTAPIFNNPLDSQNPDTQGDPFHLQAAITDDGVTLTWQKVEMADITGYIVYRNVQQNGVYEKISQVNPQTNTYTDPKAKNGQSYWYKVTLLTMQNKESSLTFSTALKVDVSGLPNRSPVASFFVEPAEGLINTAFTFNADSSSDAEDDKLLLMVRWDWENDNIWDTSYSNNKITTHQYTSEGTKIIKLEVKDTKGATNSTTRQTLVTSKTGTVTDIDGNTYRTIKIGNQWWMAENLKVTHYRNGDAIANVTDNSAWTSLSTGAYCNYDNNEANVAIYGRLYNWYAVNDGRKIAPAGWHVPTDVEWQTLVDYLGGSSVAGSKLKETDYAHWSSPNTGATNEYQFTALPGGYRGYSNGNYFDMGLYAFFWSATEISSGSAWTRYLDDSYSDVYHNTFNRRYGFSVRLVRDNRLFGGLGGVSPWNVSTGINQADTKAMNSINFGVRRYGDALGRSDASERPKRYSNLPGSSELPGR